MTGGDCHSVASSMMQDSELRGLLMGKPQICVVPYPKSESDLLIVMAMGISIDKLNVTNLALVAHRIVRFLLDHGRANGNKAIKFNVYAKANDAVGPALSFVADERAFKDFPVLSAEDMTKLEPYEGIMVSWYLDRERIPITGAADIDALRSTRKRLP